MDSLEYKITVPTGGMLVVSAPRGMSARDYDAAIGMLDLIREQWGEWKSEAQSAASHEFSPLSAACTG